MVLLSILLLWEKPKDFFFYFPTVQQGGQVILLSSNEKSYERLYPVVGEENVREREEKKNALF